VQRYDFFSNYKNPYLKNYLCDKDNDITDS